MFRFGLRWKSDYLRHWQNVPFDITHRNQHRFHVARGMRAITQDFTSQYSGPLFVSWQEQPKHVLFVMKPGDSFIEQSLKEVTEWFTETFPSVKIVLEHKVAQRLGSSIRNCISFKPEDEKLFYSQKVDFVVGLGGDGTLLHIASLFETHAPPVVAFSMGSLGFLMPFKIGSYREVLSSIMTQGAMVLPRMRLQGHVYSINPDIIKETNQERRQSLLASWFAEQRFKNNLKEFKLQALNEWTMHRSRQPHMTVMDCYVNESYLTDVMADGLVIATPTGSSAYSLSAGGSIIHPTLHGIALTPICPRSLSFRPLLLPPNVTLQLLVSRNTGILVEVCVDGRDVLLLGHGDYLEISVSPFPVPTVMRTLSNNQDTWLHDLTNLLKWNQRFTSSSQMNECSLK